MEKRLFSHDPTFGITRYAYLDDEKDMLHIETVQDIRTIIEINKKEYNETEKSTRYGDGMHRVANIPLNILESLMQQGILVPGKKGDGDGNKRFKKWLNDPDNRFFKTRNGRV